MMTVGIDALSFFSSNYYVDLATIAKAGNVSADKYYQGLGQYKMAIAANDEDIVTLGANAANNIIDDSRRKAIDLVLIATESSVDQSKAAGIFIHHLLGLSEHCRILEVKQACYSTTAALQLGLSHIHCHPDSQVLLIGSDIARYGLSSPGEPSQGCGAVALILKESPRLVAIEPGSGYYTQDIMDFWRPNYRDEALVEGKYSSKMYLHSLEKSWRHYQANTQRTFSDHARFCYHTPVPRLAEKAHAALARIEDIELDKESFNKHTQDALKYNRTVGNCYAASLYLSLASLLDHCKEDLSQQRIGFYSYGSGSVAEFFSGIVQTNYRKHLLQEKHQQQLHQRQELNYGDYKALYTYQLPRDGSDLILPKQQHGKYRLAKMMRHKRIYEEA